MALELEHVTESNILTLPIFYFLSLVSRSFLVHNNLTYCNSNPTELLNITIFILTCQKPRIPC